MRLLSDGRWIHEGPENAGVPAEPGPTAVVEVDGVTLVLNSKKVAPGDQQQLKSVGIDPLRQHIIVVKAAVRWRGGFGPIAKHAIHVNTPGLGDVRLRTPLDLERTQMNWPIDPTGLDELLVDLHAEFGNLPISITENGSASADVVGADGQVHDTQRIEFLATHVSAVHRAIEAGVNVESYFAWSLMDNFEWSWGYERRFGITHVDYQTQQRTPKDSAKWFSELIRTRQIPSTDPTTWS